MNLRILLVLVLAMLLPILSGCGSGSTSVDPEYEITLAATYNRQAETLSVELLHSADADIFVNFVTPTWVTLEIVQTRELADGRLIMDLNAVLWDSLDNVDQITVIATDDYGTRETRDLVIKRPVFVSELSTESTQTGVTVDVTVDAAGTNAVGVTVTPPTGFSVLDTTEQTGTGNSMYTFELAYPPEVVLTGGTGNGIVHVRAFDDVDHEFFQEVIIGYDVAAPVVPAGALAAIPLKSLVHVGEPVTLAVLSGGFDDASPFYDLGGCGLTLGGGAGFVAGSFNCGMPGEEYNYPDGIWKSVQAAALYADDATAPERVDLGDGGYRFDFAVTAAGGAATTAGGVLFTFDVTFAEAGEIALGFQEFEHTSLTFFNDGTVEHHWDDTTNDYPGVANSVTVVR